MPLLDDFGALRDRRFRLLWVGQTTSMLGDALVPVALAFAVLDLTHSATDLGLVLAAQVIPNVALVLAGGVVADRLPRQMVMLASDIVRGAAQAVLAVLVLTGGARLWQLVMLAAVYGAAEAFFQPASTGLVPATVPPERLQQANALLGLSRSVAVVFGPALAGVIVGLYSPGVAFAADAATFVVSAASLARLRTERSPAGERASFMGDFAGGWREVHTRTWLWVMMVWASTFMFFVAAPMQVLGPLIAKQSLGGAPAWGTIAAAGGIGSVVGGMVALRWRPTRPLFAASSVVLATALPAAFLAVPAPVAVISIGRLMAGASLGFFGAVWMTTLQEHIPPEAISRVSAYDWMGSQVFLPLGLLAAGPIQEAIGASATLWISAGWAVVSTAAVLGVRSVRDLKAREPVGAGERAEPSDAVP
jgi:predicted MFS family arabinose efflux permease